MKIKTLISYVCVCGITLVSCEKYSLETQNPQNEKINVQLSNGMLAFKSLDDFLKVKHKVSELSDENYELWLEETNFNSYEKEYVTVLNELENAKTYEEYLSIINENNDIIKVENDVIKPIVKSSSLRKIINRKGEVIIGEQYTFFDCVYQYSMPIENYLNKKSNCKAYELTKNRWLMNIDNQNIRENQPIWCPMSYHSEVKNNDGDRKACLDLFLENIYKYFETYQQVNITSEVTIEGTALKKNIWGNWVIYKTNNYLNYDFSIVKNEIGSIPKTYQGSKSNTDRVYCGFTETVQNITVHISQDITNSYLFQRVGDNNYTHRGMDGKTAVLKSCTSIY